MKNKFFHQKFSLYGQAQYARRMATLLAAGISLPEALSFLLKSVVKKKTIHRVFSVICTEVERGRTYSETLQASELFDTSLVHMVRIGERSGSLEQALIRAAEMLERRDQLSKKLTGIMVYPAFIGIATLGIAGFLVMYIFPKII